MKMKRNIVAVALTFALLALLVVPARVSAQGVLLKDIANVQGVTANQLIGYGIVTGLNQTGDSTSVLFTSKTIQNILQTFGLSTASTDVRTRDVAAVMVTHDANAATYADRVVFLADGKVVGELASPTVDSVLDQMMKLRH